MKLVLSSVAGPGASAAELVEACRRRGLMGIEYVQLAETGTIDNAASLHAALQAQGLELSGIVRPALDGSQIRAAAAESSETGAPIIVPAASFDWLLLPEVIEVFARTGGRLLLAHRSHPELMIELLRLLDEASASPTVGLAWEFRPATDNARMVEQVLESGGDRIRYVRMYGGGPEAHAQTGMGVGSVMGRLTLARYDGPIVLLPSESRYHYVWSAWLGRAGGWGCGSKQADDTLVSLAAAGGQEG